MKHPNEMCHPAAAPDRAHAAVALPLSERYLMSVPGGISMSMRGYRFPNPVHQSCYDLATAQEAGVQGSSHSSRSMFLKPLDVRISSLLKSN